MTTHRGHANAWGEIGVIDFRDEADTWVEQVERRGGFMSINHPVADDCAWLHPLERMPPGAELFHGTWYRNLADTSILAWAAMLPDAVVVLGGGDFHNRSTPLRPGNPIYEDVNGDNVVNTADQTVLGNSQPLFTYGFNTTLTWGRVDVFLALAGSYGNKLFNGLATRLTKGSTYYNSLAIVADRWTETNPSDRIQRASDDLTIVSDSRYVEDASYLRLKNVQVGYTLPLRQVTKDAQIRLFLSLQNFVTLTRYSGYDPEASRNGMDEHSALYQGVDMGTYPTAKTVQVGLQLTL